MRGDGERLHPKLLYRPTLALVLASIVVCAPGAAARHGAEGGSGPWRAEPLGHLAEDVAPLDLERSGAVSSAVLAYFDRYDLYAGPREHHFGTVHSGRHTVAVHVFRPQRARGTVLLLHGFLDHVGTLSATIHHLLKQGLAVIAYDQPGHGLSSGPRAHIEDFSEYAGVFEDVLRLCRGRMPLPCHALAHSAGAAIVVNHLLSRRPGEIEQAVLIAPLVHSAHWNVSRMLSPILELVVDDVPRVFRDSSSDERFLQFLREDPLQPRRASLAWFRALVDWNERVEAYPPSDRPIVIVQGDADSVVDWGYNLAFLAGKFPCAHVEIIEGGRHHLLNETPALRSQALRIVDEVLAGRWADPQC